ncbi:MAG: hypothetical protein ACJ79K_05840 [Gemmatimonadaceae bacterium]
MRSLRFTALVLGIAGISAFPAPAAAQSQLDVHGNWARTTATHTTSWGAGIGFQATVGGKSSPIALSAAPSFDYLKQENSGPAQEILSLDLDLQPGGSGTVIPYVGASAGANWSSGSGKQWEGTKLGLETLGGVQLKVGTSALSLKGEERFGYVRGQEHTLTTRFGVLISM